MKLGVGTKNGTKNISYGHLTINRGWEVQKRSQTMARGTDAHRIDAQQIQTRTSERTLSFTQRFVIEIQTRGDHFVSPTK